MYEICSMFNSVRITISLRHHPLVIYKIVDYMYVLYTYISGMDSLDAFIYSIYIGIIIYINIFKYSVPIYELIIYYTYLDR